MSEIFVRPVIIDDIISHPNADALEIARVGGWYTIVKKEQFKCGDEVIHFPPEAMIPRELSEELGVSKFLGWTKNSTHGRVLSASIRGVISFGFLTENMWGAKIGEDLKERLNIYKYEPPESANPGDFATRHPLYAPFYDVENIRNYMNVFKEDEEVVVTEKIDGTNSSLCVTDDFGEKDSEDVIDGLLFMCGSRGGRRKLNTNSVYEKPYFMYPKIRDMMRDIYTQYKEKLSGPISVIVRGEIFGNVQKLKYGRNGVDWRMFDISVNGVYIDWDDIVSFANKYDVPTVPVIYRGTFSFSKIEELAEGDTVVGNGLHIREGVVIKPTKERTCIEIGRVILKLVSGTYLTSKNASAGH
jgi:RNA ligase (TIGR02306 family)